MTRTAATATQIAMHAPAGADLPYEEWTHEEWSAIEHHRDESEPAAYSDGIPVGWIAREGVFAGYWKHFDPDEPEVRQTKELHRRFPMFNPVEIHNQLLKSSYRNTLAWLTGMRRCDEWLRSLKRWHLPAPGSFGRRAAPCLIMSRAREHRRSARRALCAASARGDPDEPGPPSSVGRRRSRSSDWSRP
jgi:hypothetical protein